MKSRILLLIMLLCLVMPMGVSAEGGLTPQEICPALSDADVENVEMIFNVERRVKIIDADGNDVTQQFILANRSFYNAKEYMPILDYLIDNELVIQDSYAKRDIAPFALRSTASSGTLIVYFDSPITGELTKQWIKFRVEADYQVVDSTGVISAGILPARAVFEGKSGSSLWVYAEVTESEYTINQNRTIITFFADFTAYIGKFEYMPLSYKSGSVQFYGQV